MRFRKRRENIFKTEVKERRSEGLNTKNHRTSSLLYNRSSYRNGRNPTFTVKIETIIKDWLKPVFLCFAHGFVLHHQLASDTNKS
jgi:hypothetical protein